MIRKTTLLTATMLAFAIHTVADNIVFADDEVKQLCIANWDLDNDGELSSDEAQAVQSLGNVFRGNKKITTFEELRFFTGLTAIDEYAFYQSSITSVAFPETATTIGKFAFYQSSISGELHVPGTVKSIANYAFNSCLQLTSVVLEEGVETVGWHTFSGPITTLMLPTTLTYMNSMAVDPYASSLPQGDNLYVYIHSETPPDIDTFAFYPCFAEGHLVVPLGFVSSYKAVEGWAYFGEYLEFGDVNMDGGVTPYDVELLRQYLEGGISDEVNEYMADVNGDGQVDAADMDELNTHFYAEDGTPTMMAGVSAEDETEQGGVYTMDGRRVLDDASQIHSLRPGIYIAHGRKVVVR